jgi:peptide/nickel transport system permease protein
MQSAQSYWRRVWRHFKRNRLAVIGLCVSLLLLLMALLADFLANDKPYYMVYRGKTYWHSPCLPAGLGLAAWPEELQHVDFTQLPAERVFFPPIPYRPGRINLLAPFTEPSSAHWLGTDKLGRDVMAGIIHGARISLSIGFVSVGIAILIGVTLGAMAGYFGGWIDLLMSRLFELMLAIPTFFLIITIAATLRPNISTPWSSSA